MLGLFGLFWTIIRENGQNFKVFEKICDKFWTRMLLCYNVCYVYRPLKRTDLCTVEMHMVRSELGQ